jgi:hypothetical protein
MAVYLSGSKTGTGADQTLKHELGCIPGFVLVQVDDEATATATIVSSNSTDLVVLVTNAKTYKVAAFALAN